MKTAVITGAAGGIGFACVEKFAREGYEIVAMDLAAEETALAKFAPLGDKIHYFRGNLSEGDSRSQLVEFAYAKLGHVDALINVAGVAPRQRNDILCMTEESYDFVMDINTKGTFFLTQAAAKEMVKKGEGVIVNISSMSAYTSSVSRGEYCISKAGVSMITKLFADRLAEHNIMVNEIRPGIIATGMTDKVKAKYDALIDGGLLPIKRWGKPEDIAAAVLSLCDGSLPYMTGQSLDIDGGFHIRRL